MRIYKLVVVTSFFLLIPFQLPLASDTSVKSTHVGFLHPSGVDIVGFTKEQPISATWYRYYTFGFPSIAALGLNYYSHYSGNGLTGTLGVGIGSVLYGAIAYQYQIEKSHYLKFGAGLTTSIVYTGSYPVFAYEHRF